MEAVQRVRLKAEAIEMLGGACCRCGYKEHHAALEIDHVVIRRRKTSEWNGPGQAALVVNGQLPLDKVRLLCANCHAIKTYEEDRKKFSCYQG